MTIHHDLTGIVLAGGLGLRAGGPKADLALTPGGATLLERAAASLREWCGAVLVSVRDADQAVPAGLTAVADQPAGAGPLAAVATALERCETSLAFVAACDMPDLDADTVAHLVEVAERTPDAEAVVPADAHGRLHPLHAVYRPAIAAKLRAAIADGERSMHGALTRCTVAAVPVAGLPAPGSVTNLNTLAELAAYEGDQA